MNLKSATSKLLAVSLPLYAVLSLTAMAPMNLAIGLVVIAWLMSLLLKMSASSAPVLQSSDLLNLKSEYIYFVSILSIACLISLAASAFWPLTYFGHAPTADFHVPQKLVHFLFPFFLLGVFVVQLKDQENTYERYFSKFSWLVRVWIFSLIPLGCLAVVQFFTGIIKDQIIPSSPQYYHATLMFGHHLSTASIIIFPTFVATAMALGEWLRNKRILKIELVASLSGILILFLSFARTAWLTLPIGILLILYFGMKGLSIKKKNVLATLFLFVLFLFAAVKSTIVQDRILKLIGIQERLELWKANINYFEHRPLTGIGFLKTQEMSEFYFKENFPNAYQHMQWGHAHSNFFEMLGGAGILGLLAFIAWIGFSLYLAFQTAERARNAKEFGLADVSLGVAVALILMHINGLTQVNFWEGKVFHQQMFATALLLMIRFLLVKKQIN